MRKQRRSFDTLLVLLRQVTLERTCQSHLELMYLCVRINLSDKTLSNLCVAAKLSMLSITSQKGQHVERRCRCGTRLSALEPMLLSGVASCGSTLSQHLHRYRRHRLPQPNMATNPTPFDLQRDTKASFQQYVSKKNAPAQRNM